MPVNPLQPEFRGKGGGGGSDKDQPTCHCHCWCVHVEPDWKERAERIKQRKMVPPLFPPIPPHLRYSFDVGPTRPGASVLWSLAEPPEEPTWPYDPWLEIENQAIVATEGIPTVGQGLSDSTLSPPLSQEPFPRTELQ